ncbi:MAG: Asp-tRNA(Asn)/Glu-tRNA(Gln) amidotransferase subunit GatC [Nannocystaceae bacterium]
MSLVTAKEVMELAHLSRLSLSPAEATRMCGQFAHILGYIEMLRAVDVRTTEEYLSQRQPDSSLREDQVGPMYTSQCALSAVPQRRDGMVEVPKFKED